MRIQISYPLTGKTLLYPGTPRITFDAFRSIERGDSSNSSIISLSSHAGTHIDLPRHFCHHGESVVDLLVEENTFEPAYCYDIPKKPGESITIDDFKHLTLLGTARALLVRTGFFRYRSSDPEIYIQEHSWVHPEVVGFLRQKLPDLILFGVDTISISNPVQRTMGQEAHRSFLCQKPPIMLLEDLDLSQENLSRQPWKLTFYPLVLDEIDAVPVIAFLE